MKKGDLIRKTLGSTDHGLIGIVVDILCYYGEAVGDESFTYAVVNTPKGVRRWYSTRIEVVIESG